MYTHHVRIWDDTTAPRTIVIDDEDQAWKAHIDAVSAGFSSSMQCVWVPDDRAHAHAASAREEYGKVLAEGLDES